MHGFGLPLTEIEPGSRRWLLKVRNRSTEHSRPPSTRIPVVINTEISRPPETGSLVWARDLGSLISLMQALDRVAVPTGIPDTRRDEALQYVDVRPSYLRTLLALRCRLPLLAFCGDVGFPPDWHAWGTARSMDTAIYNYICSGTNILMELVIFAIPVPLVNRLHISKRQKRALLLVFTFGGL